MATDTYDPAQCLMSFLGNPIIGTVDGTFVEVDRNEDAMTLMVGSDGESARARNNNRSGTITITLMQTSPSNDVLSAAAEADELTGAGIGAFFLKDNLGKTRVIAPNTWVKKRPNTQFGKDFSPRVWVLESDNVQKHDGGAE